MGLREDLTADLAAAFSGDLADAVTEFQAEHREPGGYDPVTGTTGETVIPYSGRGVFGTYSHQLVDGTNILATDEELVALQAEVIRAPVIGDTIAGRSVVRVQQDPAGATWRIQLRG